ncbi:MAG TPA: OmpA family protein [Kofleriaceae bacterium]|nr:OmpA family protein [Kofleriaceae bacterium]
MKLVGIAMVLAATPAVADTYLDVDAAGAVPVSSAQASVFRSGVMPSLGLFGGTEALSIGARLRMGVLRNGPAPDGNRMDPGLGGVASLGFALRFSHAGAFVEGVAGAAVTGSDVAPALEVGIGYQLAVGSLEIGPSVRYLRLVSTNDMSSLGDAGISLIGIDIGYRHAAVHRAHVVERVEPPPPPPPAPPPPPIVEKIDPDGDEIADGDATCEVDGEGCTTATIQVVDDRVFFDVDHAHVKSRGREMIAQIVEMWHAHPEWVHMTIEGHTDVRGGDAYNQDLSQRRAERVRAVFVHLGIAEDRLDVVGYGRTRPRDPGSSDEAHQRNRRVEFVIERRRPQ